MAKNTLPLLVVTVFQFVSFSTGKDDEWVDYTDMLRYDSVKQSMTGQDDPCAKCYKMHGLWAPLLILKHAPPEDLVKLGLTILFIVLVPIVLGALLRRWGSQSPHPLPPVAAPQQMTQNADDSEEDSEGEDDNKEAPVHGDQIQHQQQIRDNPTEATGHPEQMTQDDDDSGGEDDNEEALVPGDLNQPQQIEDNPTVATESPEQREEMDNDNAPDAAGNESDAEQGERPNMGNEPKGGETPVSKK
ncbi:uncharacterized protein LOC134466274 [Engraulis encrasicolus]|uniref:uncharacterized protein LOC134466274 n=1 Tax=Engraulis encrasicolus TaxID=184585 RepID=UPI002FD12707